MSKRERIESMKRQIGQYCNFCQMVTSASRDGLPSDSPEIKNLSDRATSVANQILAEFNKLLSFAEAHEQWEADVLNSDEPTTESSLLDENFIKLQKMRNEILGK